jgi:UPF0716 family protein affecting phage T7 exclusion
MDRRNWRLIAGFALLVPGFLTVLILPEIGVPLLLFGTRLLGDRFKWAQALNSRVDQTGSKAKVWLNKFRKK